jgi:isoquinoline 1-oxidoreductase beta subunit
MYERMYVEDSQLKPTIYGPYKMALMRHAPKEINVEIINGTGKPGAVGEPPMGPIGAAIANAVYRITRQRLREMPLTLA